ncbi:MAG: MFS transporter [Candidatus Limnocylindrales bacterium]
MAPDEALARDIRRNTVLLGSAFAVGWSIIQLQSALTAITTELLTGETAIAGVGSAIFLLALGLVAVPAGRLMDRVGRGPVLVLGFAAAAVASGLLFVAVQNRLVLPFFGGIAALGLGLGTVSLARAGAADMAPPEQRAARVGRVLLGAAVGAILGPIVFSPLLADRVADPVSLAVPWILAAGLAVLGAIIVLGMRRDPLAIARELGLRGQQIAGPSRTHGIRGVYTDPALRAGLLAVIVAQVVMSAAMSTVGLGMIHAGHDLQSISVALAVHFVGMFGLSPLLGRLVDRIGRRLSISVGLSVVAVGAFGLALGVGLVTVLPSIFLVGAGWSLAYLSGTALIADATVPQERAAALGALDLGSLVGSAAATLLAPALLGLYGLPPLAIAAAGVAALPALLLFASGRRVVATAT